MTDFGLIAVIGELGFLVGCDRVVAVQLPVLVLAAIFGVWLFAVQHRFEYTFWVRHNEWRFTNAALRSSSHLRLPPLLQWFTGNIGLHHIHHLNPCILNYRLQECHDANPMLQTAPVLTLWSGLGQGSFALWDEEFGTYGAVEIRWAPRAPIGLLASLNCRGVHRRRP